MNTLLEYLYRDASNYKQHGSVVLQGAISLKDIQPLLIDGEYFIPSQAGLPDLQHKFKDQGFEYPTEDDHAWHEIVSMRPSRKQATLPLHRKEFLALLQRSLRAYCF
ncbi:MAG TPA: hypothetical protein DCZ92_08905 [Elusimicrobia bacterium]|nr:MAG: hypothetical protein A2016_01620 [Elusimicrobia bacterium GWF2_62_30]HBA60924.1 hypothetical protein [Elusimicrobiota bacterium]